MEVGSKGMKVGGWGEAHRKKKVGSKNCGASR